MGLSLKRLLLKDVMMTDTPTTYAFCFDQGDLHVFRGEEPWCTAAWVTLSGSTRDEALEDKRSRFGKARFVDDLPLEQQVEVLQLR
ncbi:MULTISPECIES: hypothetical protein [unclassified Streptomyces]|uniref:hypothetical protein n=1 Tax=unclassified Streptomyces TaxID=2593676 RepID=UPI0037F41630